MWYTDSYQYPPKTESTLVIYKCNKDTEIYFNLNIPPPLKLATHRFNIHMNITQDDIDAMREDHTELLVILMEECAEVIQEASKLIRFPENNTDKLIKELGDLQCMISLATNHLDIDPVEIAVQIGKKRKKLEIYSSLFS